MNHESRIKNLRFFQWRKFLFTALILNSLFIILAPVPVAGGDVYSSTNFQILDPVISAGAGRSTSNGFELFSNTGQVGIGENSVADFILRSGFLYFAAPAAGISAGAAAGGNVPVHLLSFFSTPEVKALMELPPAQAREKIRKVQEECPGPLQDLNCDGKVGVADFSIFLFLLSLEADPNPADFNGNGQVAFDDLSILLSAWTEQLLVFNNNNYNPDEVAFLNSSPSEDLLAYQAESEYNSAIV